MASKEHQELASIIKKLHVDLRMKSKLAGADKAWSDHVQCAEQLEIYASAMFKLATEHWDKNNKNSESLCRIQWVIHRCYGYFKDGGLQNNIEKEIRLYKKYFGVEFSHSGYNEHFNVVKNNNDKLYLLDVGSCYNPFKRCEDFHSVPIDLVPATSDVIQCDFLNVGVSPKMDVYDIKNPCRYLPESTFDIVVFSLLLEYFPSSKQRWTCCKKAYDLLKRNGILIILTPDSKHATANSKIIKNWRFVLADIGFLLVSYEKLKHLHCLIYRKCINIEVPRYWLSSQNVGDNDSLLNFVDMICIPQDFHDYAAEVDGSEVKGFKEDHDDQVTADYFSELPNDMSDIF